MHDADTCRQWAVRERAEKMLTEAKLPSRMEAAFKVPPPLRPLLLYLAGHSGSVL